ncbi:MAG TPA: sugar phosphate nucleotidyltransferase [Ferruginibacter sp.]|nr:sugar phosphate nucleotidyltransferase [Ferruginibacter sp.]
MQPTLLILAAGMASRYGSMKQTEGFGPGGETIMDYSIYDAIHSGFGKVVFVIRKDFAENFKAIFDKKLKGRIEVEYVFQEMNDFVKPGQIPEGRTKPWGTGHAVLCARGVINEPFAVINADDFYGRDSFMKAAHFLQGECDEKTYAIIGYRLDKTLSDHGTVSRGVCEVNEFSNLVTITERTRIYRENGKIIYEEDDNKMELPGSTAVSMNFWCFDPAVFRIAKNLFEEFVQKNYQNIKAEFFIPLIADYFIKNLGGEIKLIPTTSQWFGVTYKEDADGVRESINQLISNGDYPAKLWEAVKY